MEGKKDENVGTGMGEMNQKLEVTKRHNCFVF
jgi:hypothetical protein